MFRTLIFLLTLHGTFLSGSDPASTTTSSSRLPRATPESQGISSKALAEFLLAADQSIHDMHSFMLIRHGKVVAEAWWAPYNADSKHELYSLSKSFTSTAVGMAIAEGKFQLDDKVCDFFPEDLPENPSPKLLAMRVRDLLTMSTGHSSEPRVGATEPWTKTFLHHEVVHEPGSHFLYNTPATYMLSAIVQKKTGQTTHEYLQSRLFEPLGIVDSTWGKSPQGVSLGGYGLNVRTEDIAAFGLLYLNHGQFQGKQLIPADWVAQATSRQVSNGSNPNSDWNQGYGFQFWRCRHNAFRGDGAFGQYCLVIPEEDTVIAITSGVKDMQASLNLIWDKLLPALGDSPLSENVEQQTALKAMASQLTIPTVEGVPTSALAKSGSRSSFAFDANDQKLSSVTIDAMESGQVSILMKYEDRETTVQCQPKQWTSGKVMFTANDGQPMASCGAWTSENEYTVKMCLYETPYILTMRFQIDGDKLTLKSESNVSFGPTERPALVGKRQGS